MIVNQNICIIDVETGGFTPKEVLLTQVAFIIVDSINFEEKERFNSYIKPYDENLYITKQASELTGITKEMLIEQGRPLEEVILEISNVLKKHKMSYYLPILCGHNISFDKMFLEDAFNRVFGVNSGKGGVNKLYDFALGSSIDTMFLARQTFCKNELPNFKLETIGDYLGKQNRSAHDAFADVEQTLELYKYFTLKMRNGGDIKVENKENKDFPFQF